MGRNNDFERRTVLCGVAGVLAAGVLAGCSGGSGGNGSDGGSGGNGAGTGDSGGETGTTNDRAAATETDGSTAAGTVTSIEMGGDQSAQVESWLAGANGYDGSIADMTGTDTIEIAVGAGERGFAFDPAAVRVSSGTTVRWTWVGGAHNVVAQDGAFDSGEIQVGSDITYEATLDQSGTHLYYCEPHRKLGMKGAVVVSG